MRPIIKTKPGINNNDTPISLNLFKISGPKLAPIVQPKSALQIGLGFLPIMTGLPIAAKKPQPINGPNIQGRGNPK